MPKMICLTDEAGIRFWLNGDRIIYVIAEVGAKMMTRLEMVNGRQFRVRESVKHIVELISNAVVSKDGLPMGM